ncbi:MAG: hypothetical protein ACOC32_02135 [Nanoarchaeota archaeon]
MSFDERAMEYQLLDSYLRKNELSQEEVEVARNDISEETIQEFYDRLWEERGPSPIRNAKKIYQLTQVPPSDDLLDDVVHSSLQCILPIRFRCNMRSGRITLQVTNIATIGKLLDSYYPLFPAKLMDDTDSNSDLMKPISSFPYFSNGLRNIVEGDVEVGGVYELKLSIMQDVNLLGEYMGQPYILTNVAPKRIGSFDHK